MFAVIFEVRPRNDQRDNYLGNAKMLRPELEQIDGFVDNIRYQSLTRDGWLLSLSNWRDEKAVVRWRTRVRHHEVQQRGRDEILMDYHLRVGQLTQDTQLPSACELREQRLDETQVGEGTFITLVAARSTEQSLKNSEPLARARTLGLNPEAPGLVSWDVFDAVLTPGDLILMLSWRSATEATRFESETHTALRLRHVRVVRDYGMYDRREAPQYYPDAKNGTTKH
jgi:heme-degrading monooxygenase HmoA